jgi:hypothetical protein
MLQSLKTRLQWNWYETVYVAQYRKELQRVAKELRNHGYPLARACLNRQQGCIRIYTWLGFGSVVAAIRMHGSEGAPYMAIVTSPSPLSEKSKELFKKAIRFTIRFDAP